MKFEKHDISVPFKPETEETEKVTISVIVDGHPYVYQIDASEAPDRDALQNESHKEHKNAKAELENLIVDAFDLTGAKAKKK